MHAVHSFDEGGYARLSSGRSRPRPESAQLAIILSALALAFPTGAEGSGIEASGSTNTVVTVAGDGKSAITPAAPRYDVSYNAFASFDVGKAGAVFLNADVGARAIVAEVFSASPSRIEGPVSVDGPRANLILANQNGIRVDGGGFVNFGSVALTTGAVTLRDEELAPGHSQRYVDVATHAGDIQIGPGGLSADLIRLEFIAKQVGISGPITNAYTSPTAVARIVAGNSEARFDTAASPTDNLTPWVYYTPGTDSVTGIAVDIAADAKVTSGRIEILVTDQGAGVRNAGELLASAGDFSLTAAGRIEQVGGRISAAGNVRIDAEAFAQANREGQQSSVTAARSVRIDSDGDLNNIGGVISGAGRDAADPDTPYAVMLNIGGQLEHRSNPDDDGAIIFSGNDDVGIFAAGGILGTGARIVSNGALRMVAGAASRNETLYTPGSGRRDWSTTSSLLFGLLDRDKRGYSVAIGALSDPDHPGQWVAEGDLTITAPGLENLGGYIFSNNGDVRIDVDRVVRTQAHAIGSYSYWRSCLWFICDQEAASSESLVGGQINAGGSVHIRAGEAIVNDGGNVFAVADVVLDAPEILARGRPVHTAILRDDGLKAMFGDTWARIYANDQGGGYTAQQGRMILRGAVSQERGYFAAGEGVDGVIEVIEPPRRDPVTIEDHLGILFW